MAFIEMETQLDDAMELLNGIQHNEQRIRKSVLGMFGTKAKNAAKRNYTSVLHKRSGYLYKTIRKYTYTNGKAVVITAHRNEDTNRYGFVLAHGATIEPRNHKTLTFFSNGKWVRRHSVTIKSKDFIERPVLDYVSGSQIDKDLENITQRIIEKTEQRAAAKAAKAQHI